MAIMTIAKLHCYQCDHDFPLNMYQPITKISCPYCDTDVDGSMIEPIRNAWAQVSGLNHSTNMKWNQKNHVLVSIFMMKKFILKLMILTMKLNN